jgi:hypothetical protein
MTLSQATEAIKAAKADKPTPAATPNQLAFLDKLQPDTDHSELDKHEASKLIERLSAEAKASQIGHSSGALATDKQIEFLMKLKPGANRAKLAGMSRAEISKLIAAAMAAKAQRYAEGKCGNNSGWRRRTYDDDGTDGGSSGGSGLTGRLLATSQSSF